MYVHRPSKLRSALRPEGELVSQPQLGRCTDCSRGEVSLATASNSQKRCQSPLCWQHA